MTNTLDIIALEAANTSRVSFSTIAELASAICEGHLDTWSHRMLEEAGIRLNVIGRQHIREDGGYIVMSNRQSRYDIPVLYQALGIPMQMVESKEIPGIPLRAVASGKQILPVTIDGTQAISASGGSHASPERTATVTIGEPIDPTPYGREKIGRLITVVKDAIESNLSASS
jgi:1-acyl-sn-glycerol-3-phosphate acyltransferase